MEVSELVSKAKSGDVDAFTELVRRYQAMAFGYAYSRIGDYHLSEDIVQQAFVAAYHSLPKLQQPKSFGGWLRSIVRFECSHLLRTQRPQLSIEDAMDIAERDEPARIVEEGEEFDCVVAAVNSLREEERDVAILYYIHDHSQREVAEFLELPVTTVNNRLRTARKHLKKGRLLAMANDAFSELNPPEEFASRIGEIIRSQGPIVDARFSPGQRPRVLNALTVTNDSSGRLPVTVETIQHLDDDLVRGIATANEGVEFSPGMRITDTGGPISIPLESRSISQLIASLRSTNPSTGIVETGIKVIDLLCPLPRNGRIALVGNMRSGKMVLVEELIHRLTGSEIDISIFVFVETSAEVAIINELEYRTSASVEAIFLPVADTSPDALQDVTSELDCVITFSHNLAEARLYPAIDPAASTSRLLDPAVVGSEHVDTAASVRELLEESGNVLNDADSETALRLRQFLTQPYFVAEEFTYKPGKHVPISETIDNFKLLLNGNVADISEEDLSMIGSLGDAINSS